MDRESEVIVRCLSHLLEIGLLQEKITWYKIRYAGGQAHYYSRPGTSK